MNQFLRDSPESRVGLLFARVGGDAEDASQDANDIAVENWLGLVEGNAANRAGGVAANAGEGKDCVEIFGEFASVPGDDLLRGALQVANAGVVAEAFPKF